ncbi:MAG: PRD domain-containing protein [Erysipelotrichaceae bacterium]
MKIERILNNNVVIILDAVGNEQVVCGKGIAFKKKPGDSLEESEVNKTFVLQNKQINNRFQELLADIPIEHVQVADSIINYAKMELGKSLNDTILISLSDHIYTAIDRFLEGITVPNALLWEIKRFYETEFKIGLKALEMIEEQFKVKLPIDEAGFIALHIANAEMDESNMTQVFEITKIIQEVSNIVKYHFGVEFEINSVYYYRFITHLKFFAQRLILGKQNEDSEADDGLLDLVKAKYYNAYNCTEKISGFILRKHGHQLTNEEKLYLTIHIERVIYKTKN